MPWKMPEIEEAMKDVDIATDPFSLRSCKHEPEFMWAGYKIIHASDGEISKPLVKLGACVYCRETYEVIDDLRSL